MIIGAQVDAEVKRQSNRVKEILLANSVRRTEFSIKRHHSSRPSINMISLETCMKLLMMRPSPLHRDSGMIEARTYEHVLRLEWRPARQRNPIQNPRSVTTTIDHGSDRHHVVSEVRRALRLNGFPIFSG